LHRHYRPFRCHFWLPIQPHPSRGGRTACCTQVSVAEVAQQIADLKASFGATLAAGIKSVGDAYAETTTDYVDAEIKGVQTDLDVKIAA